MLWWSKYGDFEADSSGLYPQARQVMTHYLGVSGLSRAQVATHLGIGEKAVYYMEHEGRGLDSIVRLRQAAALLHIPPALFVLCDAPGVSGWWLADYKPWPSGADGCWPSTGAVIKHYRNAKRWTQGHLAEALGINELSVRKMENRSVGLDSLTRRRSLRFLLDIPPILLGLDVAHSQPGVPSLLHPEPALPALGDIRSAQLRLWQGYYSGDGFDQLDGMNLSLAPLKEALPSLPAALRSSYLEETSLLYQAAGNVLLASADLAQVQRYFNAGIKYARQSGSISLLSTALGRRAAALFELGEQEAAQKNIREALYVAEEDVMIKRYPVASRVLSCSAQDQVDRSEVLGMLDGMVENDDYNKGDDKNILVLCRAQVLVNLAQNASDRRELLRQTSDLLTITERSAPDRPDTDTPRRWLLIRLAQSRAALGLREFDQSAVYAIEAFQLMRQLNSVLYLPQFVEIYQVLSQSSFRSSPHVARLGLLLFQVGS